MNSNFLPSDWIEFGKPRISVRIPAKGKETVSVPYVLRNFGLYSEDVQIKAVPDNGAPVTFIRKLHGIFKGNSGRFGGDIVDHWIAVNGPVTIGLNKLNNDIWVSHFQANNQYLVELSENRKTVLNGIFQEKG